MSEIIKEPSDAEFSALLNERAPNRLQMAEPLPEHDANASLLGSSEFPVVDAPPEETVETPAPEAAPVVPAVDPKYAGKTTDELIEMHRNAESRLGTQGQELGELRALRSEFDHLRGELAAREAQAPVQPMTQETVDWVEEAMIGNPHETIAWVQANQPALYQRAIQTWASIDPFAASDFNVEQKLRAQQAQFSQELASVRAPVVEQQANTQLQAAYLATTQSLPGFTDVVGDLPDILEASPELRVALVNGDQAQKQRILENLGKVALANRALAQNTAPEEVVPAGPTAAEVAHAAKVAASVASGSSAGEHGGEAPTKTEALKSSMLTSGPTSIREELARNRAQAAR
jgi:hypothetical protein